MTEPEKLERERASDVPEGAEVRADGSYVIPADTLTEEQKETLLPPEQTEQEKALEAEHLQELADAERQSADLDSPPREQGTYFEDGAQ